MKNASLSKNSSSTSKILTGLKEEWKRAPGMNLRQFSKFIQRAIANSKEFGAFRYDLDMDGRENWEDLSEVLSLIQDLYGLKPLGSNSLKDVLKNDPRSQHATIPDNFLMKVVTDCTTTLEDLHEMWGDPEKTESQRSLLTAFVMENHKLMVQFSGEMKKKSGLDPKFKQWVKLAVERVSGMSA